MHVLQKDLVLFTLRKSLCPREHCGLTFVPFSFWKDDVDRLENNQEIFDQLLARNHVPMWYNDFDHDNLM